MKKLFSRALSIVLATILLCGALPLAGATDTDPPLYAYLGCESPEQFLAEFAMDDTSYEWFNSTYAEKLAACLEDEQAIIDYWGYSLPTSAEILGITAKELPHYTAWNMTWDAYLDIVSYDDPVAFTPPSVELNGETVVFPDAAPENTNGRVMVPLRPIVEALDGKISFENNVISVNVQGKSLSMTIDSTALTSETAESDKKTTQMDVAPYIKEGRTYVPVRFFAEAFGFTVEWDEWDNIAVIYDRAALVTSIDKNFTIVNQWFAAQPTTDPTQKLSAMLHFALGFTALNSIDGNQTAKMDGTLNMISENENYQVSFKCDAFALVKLLLTAQNYELLDSERGAMLNLIGDDLENLTVDLIYNADEDTMYLHCPALLKIISISTTSSSKVDANVWLKIENPFESYLPAFMDISNLTMPIQDLTMGNFIVLQSEINTQGMPSLFWSDTEAKRDALSMLRDDQWIKNGESYTTKFNHSITACGDIVPQSYDTPNHSDYSKGQLTLHSNTGLAEGTFEARSYDYSNQLITCSFSGNAAAAKFSVKIHENNLSILDLTIDAARTPAASAPATKPPAKDKVVSLSEWFQTLFRDYAMYELIPNQE